MLNIEACKFIFFAVLSTNSLTVCLFVLPPPPRPSLLFVHRWAVTPLSLSTLQLHHVTPTSSSFQLSNTHTHSNALWHLQHRLLDKRTSRSEGKRKWICTWKPIIKTVVEENEWNKVLRDGGAFLYVLRGSSPGKVRMHEMNLNFAFKTSRSTLSLFKKQCRTVIVSPRVVNIIITCWQQESVQFICSLKKKQEREALDLSLIDCWWPPPCEMNLLGLCLII